MKTILPVTTAPAPRSIASLRCTAFSGPRRIASGELGVVAVMVKKVLGRSSDAPVLIFDDATSDVVDVDWRGTSKDVLARLEARPQGGVAAVAAPQEPEAPRGPGRPKLGVVAREVTLLPRHWEWLSSQPGGASVAIRKLVEEARKSHSGRDRKKRSQEAAYKFMSAMAGNAPGFEEASRALFAGDAKKFDEQTKTWPQDWHDHARMLAREALP